MGLRPAFQEGEVPMLFTRMMRLAGAVLLVCLMAIPHQRAQAESFVGTDVESRVIIGLTANLEAVQAKMPEGWAAMPFPSGPLKGANLLVSFIDGHVMLDADGKPLAPASRRAVTLVGLGKQIEGDQVRLFVLRIYTTVEDSDPYGNAMRAGIARTITLTGPADGPREVSDFWRVVPEAGGKIRLELDFTTGRRGWSPSEAKSFSASNPDFHRIYRYDSITDVVQSAAMGKPISGSVKLEVSILELADMFDGSETIAAILDVPVRVRKTFLPD